MLRTFFQVICALAMLQASGVPSAMSQTECRQRCEDDDARAQCPPTCACCSCCSHRAPMVALSFSVEEQIAPEVRAVAQPESLPASLSPPEIWHVPKSLRS